MILQSYKFLKKSHIGWIKTYPSHWQTTYVKYESYVKARVGWHGLKSDDFTDQGPYLVTGTDFQDFYINWDGCYHCELDRYKQDPFIQLKNGDLLITKDGTIGKLVLVSGLKTTEKATLNSGIFVVRPLNENTSTNFYFWLLQSCVFHDFVNYNKTGSTIIHLYQDTFINFVYASPTIEEQNKITEFLNHETAKIDSLIEKQQQLIELLKEKRQAVISHAVTKGLNPDVPMKESRVEWLGKVPKTWRMVPLKYLCEFSGGGTPSKDNLSYWVNGTIPWVSPKDMKSFLINEAQDYITERAVSESSTKIIRSNSLLIVVRSGILQHTIPIAINSRQVTINQDMKALYFTERMHTHFFAYFIMGYINALLTQWTKEGTTVESIEHEYLANSLVPVPSLQEQQSIISHLEKQIKIFQGLEESAILGIQLLKERRTALISAAVTGKIDVRNWVAPISETETHPEAEASA
jgi:Restriction endonuclease S subunits